MKLRACAIIALVLALLPGSALAADRLRNGDRMTLTSQTALELALHTNGGPASRDKAVQLQPGATVKVVGATHGLGKPWYEVETSSGHGFISAVTLERQAPPRTWLDKVGKPVVLVKGKRLTNIVNSLESHVFTAPADIQTEVLEVASYAPPNGKPVTRVRVEVSIAQGKIKGWANVSDVRQ